METVFLKVTSNVLSYVGEADTQKQISIKASSSLLTEKIILANKTNKLLIRIANSIDLVLGDTGAIWRSHNQKYEKEFDTLFHFLRNYPDQEFEFICSIK
ncbi:hypothetical protein Dvar_46230 [Desulfosarcina variabilis str. Montpellier]|uniref:hypothetical protein n=1 Tax=Desulfosarcina variabilis TaxID=2300 RepID=UPI003AFA78B8